MEQVGPMFFGGGIHGVLQILEKAFDKKLKRFRNKNIICQAISTIVTFAICNIVWVFFRAESINDAIYIIYHAVFGILSPSTYFHTAIGLGKNELLGIFITFIILAVYDGVSLKNDVIKWVSSQKLITRWTIYIVLIVVIIGNAPMSNETAFIYFQF